MQDETAEALSNAYRRCSGCFNSNVVCSAIETAAGGLWAIRANPITNNFSDNFKPDYESQPRLVHMNLN
jgi:hypothetical protein